MDGQGSPSENSGVGAKALSEKTGTGLHPANSLYSELQDHAWGKDSPGSTHASSHAPLPGLRYTVSTSPLNMVRRRVSTFSQPLVSKWGYR